MSVLRQVEIKKAIKLSTEGYPKLGTVVYWSIEGFSERHAAVMQAFQSVGLPADYASPVQTKSALIKALKAHTKGKKNTFHRNVVDNEARAGFAIMNTEVTDDVAMDVEAHTSTRAVLNKTTKLVDITGPEAAAIKQTFEDFRDVYTSDRFRNAVLKVIKQHAQGVGVRDNGGIYFIPSSHDHVVDMLKDLFSKFSGCSFDTIPVIDTADAKVSMWKSVIGDVTRELEDFRVDLECSTELTERSIDVRMKKYNALKDKVENYETLLQHSAGSLKQELETLTRKLATKLAG